MRFLACVLLLTSLFLESGLAQSKPSRNEPNQVDLFNLERHLRWLEAEAKINPTKEVRAEIKRLREFEPGVKYVAEALSLIPESGITLEICTFYSDPDRDMPSSVSERKKEQVLLKEVVILPETMILIWINFNTQSFREMFETELSSASNSLRERQILQLALKLAHEGGHLRLARQLGHWPQDEQELLRSEIFAYEVELEALERFFGEAKLRGEQYFLLQSEIRQKLGFLKKDLNRLLISKKQSEQQPR
ncbi:hypothetical protein C4553_00580 [Candidatus Parcubacteria bacterium]|nr:MAG: hypothetical protein C4553_00580 [Candidatus Parcubacteria bacterium]